MIKGLELSYKVKINFTADQWGLYTCSMNCGQAARGLNSAFKKAIESSPTAYEAYQKMNEAFDKYANYGAADSEPASFCRYVLRKIYGEDQLY